jgi:hypothetical protein
MLECLLLDDLFLLPETAVLVQVLLVDCHLDNLTLCLQSSEHVLVDDSPVIDKREELIHDIGFPLAEKDGFFHVSLCWQLIFHLDDRPPL